MPRFFLLLLLSSALSVCSGVTYITGGIVSQTTSSPAISTELRILNQGNSPTNAVFTLLVPDGSAAQPAVTQGIAPGQTLRLANALQALWATDSAGALQVV